MQGIECILEVNWLPPLQSLDLILQKLGVSLCLLASCLAAACVAFSSSMTIDRYKAEVIKVRRNSFVLGVSDKSSQSAREQAFRRRNRQKDSRNRRQGERICIHSFTKCYRRKHRVLVIAATTQLHKSITSLCHHLLTTPQRLSILVFSLHLSFRPSLSPIRSSPHRNLSNLMHSPPC